MSMHKIPLTSLEEAGMKAHGLKIGTPSQLSDVFRQGVAWALAYQPQERGEAVGVVAECLFRADADGRDAKWQATVLCDNKLKCGTRLYTHPAPDAGRVAELEAECKRLREEVHAHASNEVDFAEQNAALEAQLAASRERLERLRSLAADVCLASGYENARQAVIALNTELMRLNQADAALAAEKEEGK